MKRVLVGLVASAAVFLALPASVAQTPEAVVYQFDLTGTVDPLLAHGLERAVRAADRDGVLLLIRIDTPGGLDSSMRSIVKAILASSSPVVCWVGPSGARAASAGAFILIGCPTATMAPGTNVGAAHPVGITGGILSEKVTNDAAAYIRSLAQRWNRNAAWAEKAVRESVSVSAEEAKTLEVIDRIAPTRGCALDPLCGGPQGRQSPPVRFVQQRLGIAEAVFHGLVDPNLAFLFFLFGIAGIIFEVLHPGISVPGIIGIVLFVSSLVMLGMLPVTIAGIVLLAAAMAFFVIDLKVAGHGLATAAAITCLVLGGLFLFNSSVPNARVSRPLVAGTAIAMALLFAAVIRKAIEARRLPKRQPSDALVGAEGVVERALDPQGVVRVAGEAWTATAPHPVAGGAPVRVVAVRGLTLEVEPTGLIVRPSGVGGTPTTKEGT